MQKQTDDNPVKRFVEAIKAVWVWIKRMVDQAIAWLEDKLSKRTQAKAASSMKRMLVTKRERTWQKLKMVHPHATLIAMKKRSRAHQDQRMMKRARSTLKS